MTNYKKKLIIGTRSSSLALAQTELFIEKLLSTYPDMNRNYIQIYQIKTSGDQNQSIRLDQMGGKGLFAKEIETEILNGNIDLGIHSMKDMPAEENNDLLIGCWLERHDHRDALLSISNHSSIANLDTKSIIGTSSIRRRSQVIHLRKDLSIKSLRGNIDTRIKKLKEKQFDSIILSVAGLKRLSLDHLISFIFHEDEMLPAACQGSIGVQILSENQELKNFLLPMNHEPTQILCNVERDVLKIIKANCNSPIGVFAKREHDKIKLQCQIFNHEGDKIYSNIIEDIFTNKNSLGEKMGNDIIAKLGQPLIDELEILNNDFDYTP